MLDLSAGSRSVACAVHAAIPGWVPGSVCVFEMVECLRMAVDAAVDAAQAEAAKAANHASEVEGAAGCGRRCSGGEVDPERFSFTCRSSW